MKFSYKLLKQFIPQIKSRQELIDRLTMHAFEIDSVDDDTIDIKLPPNRYGDAGSHWGIANELSAIMGKKFQIPNYKLKTNSKFSKFKSLNFKVEIKDKNLCLRYTAQYFENIKIAPSPKWMQDILKTCGLRPINNVVDIMNYVMLETGQPLHAFDFDKIKSVTPSPKFSISKQIQNSKSKIPKIIIRRAKKGEEITTLDEQKFVLDENTLAIADEKSILAIAGIKGGKAAEIDNHTKRIIVESANFDSVNIYETSKRLSLVTDASMRFSRNLSPELAVIGLNRSAQLLKEIVKAQPGKIIDLYPKRQPKRIIKFSVERFNKFIGADLDFKTIKKYLENLGFIIKIPAKNISAGYQLSTTAFFVEVPPLRTDIEFFEDVAEEVARLYGYNSLKSIPPVTHLKPSGFEGQIILKDKFRKILSGLGLSEVYNYSLISQKEGFMGWGIKRDNLIELQNPISSLFQYLRPNLNSGLLKNISDNSRFFDSIAIFEIGKIFQYQKERIFKIKEKKSRELGLEKVSERLSLGIALASKNKETFFELKGIISELFKRIGLVSFSFSATEQNVLLVKSGNEFLGEVKKVYDTTRRHISLAQIDMENLLKLIEGEHEYVPLPKYPSVMRDISIAVSSDIKVGDIIQEIQSLNQKYIEDVDLIDEYDLSTRANMKQDTNLRGKDLSLTFRIVFQAPDKTLTDKYVDDEIEKIIAALKKKFSAVIR